MGSRRGRIGDRVRAVLVRRQLSNPCGAAIGIGEVVEDRRTVETAKTKEKRRVKQNPFFPISAPGPNMHYSNRSSTYLS